MNSQNRIATALIIFGGYFLLSHFKLMPTLNPKKALPLILISLGLFLIYRSPSSYGHGQDKLVHPRIFTSVGSIFVIVLVGFVLLGFVGPIFLFLLALLPLILVASLGIAFIKLLLPILILSAPVILIIWLLTLIF